MKTKLDKINLGNKVEVLELTSEILGSYLWNFRFLSFYFPDTNLFSTSNLKSK